MHVCGCVVFGILLSSILLEKINSETNVYVSANLMVKLDWKYSKSSGTLVHSGLQLFVVCQNSATYRFRRTSAAVDVTSNVVTYMWVVYVLVHTAGVT